MKLQIGEKWHRELAGYVETLTIKGATSIESQLDEGVVVLPQHGNSLLDVEITNNASWGDSFETTKKLHVLNSNWERGPADE